MKRINLSIILLMIIGLAYGQDDIYPNYIVKFTDKNGTPFSIEHPEEFLSQRAIDRRTKQNIAIQESDLPVNPAYVQAVIDAGGVVKNRLKWINSVSVEITEASVLNQIQALSFVSQVIQVATDGASKNPGFKRDKDLIDTKKVSLVSRSVNNMNYGESYNQINMINGIPLHTTGFLGQGMLIAIFDSGFGFADEMTAFDSLRTNNQIIGTRDFVTPGNNVYSYDNTQSAHGTYTLSAMGAYIDNHLIGTAPKADYYLIRSEDSRDPSTEYLMEEYYWEAAAEFADSLGADIISSSLGYNIFYDPQFNHTYSEMDGNTTPITIAADIAAGKGILVVNSNGNSGDETWHYMGAPADGDSVFSVGAVDANGTYASFSSHGPTYDGRIKPEVVAQGDHPVLADVEGGITTIFSGTSFSAPIIAGMSACLWQANPTATAHQIFLAIRQSASTYNNPNNDIGYGIPDYAEADQIVKQMVGINEPSTNKLNVNISPNPFSSHIKVKFNKLLRNSITATIYNMNGQPIIKKIIINQTSTIDKLENIPAGIYYLRLSKDNGEFNSYKLIKL